MTTNADVTSARNVDLASESLEQSEARRLGDRILAMYLAGSAGTASGVVALPSERELSSRLEVTRYAVRNALEYLKASGELQRVAGRAAFVLSDRNQAAAAKVSEAGVRCINFVQGSYLQAQPLHWIVDEHLIGYNEVLDRYEFKTRFLFWEDERTDYTEMLWNRAPWNQQACILVNRKLPPLYAWLNAQSVPFVVQYSRPYDFHELPPHHRVYTNKIGGAAEATRHLLELGHRRIGFVGGLPATQNLTIEPPAEYEGYHAAMRCAGLTPATVHLLQLAVEDPELAIGPCVAYLSRPNRPTAVVAANGGMAVGLLRAAAALRIRVPEDLSVIGFTSPATSSWPQLSVMELRTRALARAAVELMLDVLAKNVTEFQTRILECKLVVRGSTARLGSR